MHLHFERTINAKSDCSILALTWMGKVPDELPEEEGWKLNRHNYYQEGWLATGNVRGIVGVTFTTSHCKKNVEFPLRTNYNLRGHRSEVILVKWNEPYQKLASCDSTGIIFVWIKYEGRWSIELINDRNTPVTHFSWSHDGRMALICYQDGFVLVGSVAGQRYWSSMLNLESTITCGIWTPDDQQVYFGTTEGQIIVMDVHGAMVSQVQLSSADVGIITMAWSCEKFKMDESDEFDNDFSNANDKKCVLAVCLQNGFIFLLKTYDDVSPVQIDTGLQGPLCMEWSNSRDLLAVSGVTGDTKTSGLQIEYVNVLKFYDDKGVLLQVNLVPFTQAPVSALTWGHNDRRLFLATGTKIHIAWVNRTIESLQYLCRLKIHDCIQHESQLPLLPLPARIRNLIGSLFAQTIRCCVPQPSALREFVSRPPKGSVRLHCTMIRHDEDSSLSSGTCYTLYLEYLGGLVPLLKGKRTSKIRPEFVIFDPQVEELRLQWSPESKSSTSSGHSTSGAGALTESSDSDRDEGCTNSPRMQRRRKRKNKGYHMLQAERQQGQVQTGDVDAEDLSYVDTLPEHVRLVEVTSNIWGTKFKIHGLASSVPANLGQVSYKTSLLHLQPRQMTLVITELRDDFPVEPDPNFNPNLFSEDEEEVAQAETSKMARMSIDNCPPIAPMSPRNNRLNLNTARAQINATYLTANSVPKNGPVIAKPETVEDERHLIEITADVVSYCDPIRPNTSSRLANSPPNSRPANSTQSTSFVGQFNRNSNANSTNQRHAISPLCCEGSVPALQSPKNAVAPSDIIFDRPPAHTLISYSSSDYSNGQANLQQVKSNILNEHSRNGLSFSVTPSNEHQKQILMKKVEVNANGYTKLCNGTMFPEANKTVLNTSAILNTSEVQRKPKTLFNQSVNSNNKEIRFIDEDHPFDAVPGPSAPINLPPDRLFADSIVRSCSVGFLDIIDAQMVPCDVALMLLKKDMPKRLVLVNKKPKTKRQSRQLSRQAQENRYCKRSPKLKNCGKSKSLDSSDIFPSHETGICKSVVNTESVIPEVATNSSKSSSSSPTETSEEPVVRSHKKESSRLGIFSGRSPLARRKNTETDPQMVNDKKIRSRSKQKNLKNNVNNNKAVSNTNNNNTRNGMPLHTQALANLEKLITRLREDEKPLIPSTPKLPRSSPASPAPCKKGKRPQSASPVRKTLLSSPLLGRRNKKNKNQESSDDEVAASGDEMFNYTNYKDLETFQKAQLRQKLKRGKVEPNGSSCNNRPATQRREFVMHNKAPMWNENSQVYQLDFGGRVTQESAKNFQIEFRGKQVMQFGRIDGNAYTLDFQYPFSALQAFAVALANVTQRLK